MAFLNPHLRSLQVQTHIIHSKMVSAHHPLSQLRILKNYKSHPRTKRRSMQSNVTLSSWFVNRFYPEIILTKLVVQPLLFHPILLLVISLHQLHQLFSLQQKTTIIVNKLNLPHCSKLLKMSSNSFLRNKIRRQSNNYGMITGQSLFFNHLRYQVLTFQSPKDQKTNNYDRTNHIVKNQNHLVAF